MKANKKPEKPSYAGNWIGVGVALGALVFVLTSEPVWIAVGVAIGAALDWKRPKNKDWIVALLGLFLATDNSSYRILKGSFQSFLRLKKETTIGYKF